MRARTDLGSTAHGGQLVRVFHQAHFVQQRAQVALLRRAQSAKARTRAPGRKPALDLRSQARVGGEQEPDLARFSSRRGRRAPSSAKECAASTPSAAGAASGPRR